MDPEKYRRHHPEEPEHLKCHVCLKEIPPSSAHTAEGEDYLYHFCGLGCLDEWRRNERHRGKGPTAHSGD